jgi:PEP-CTERM motif
MTSIRKTLRALAITAIPAALAFTATPASATLGAVVDPCSAGFVTGAIACQGYYGSNLITGTTGSATTADELAAINLLLNGTASTADTLPTNNTGAYNPPYTGLDYDTVLGALTDLNGTATLNFGSLNLSGLVILGAHFGNNIDSDVNNVTAFWLIDLGNVTTNTITLADGAGSSNAQIFATGDTRLPEPSTWAMMLLGFGAVGFSVRRSRRKNTLVSQLA